jgi:hypothetical protein
MSLGDGGFVDMSLDAESRVFLQAGVTAALDAMNDEAKIFPFRDSGRTPDVGADVFACGGAFTPTRGHGTEYGLPPTSYRIVDTVAEVKAQMADLASKKPDAVKIFYDHRGFDGGPDVRDGEEGVLGVAMRKDVMTALVAESNARHLKTYVHIGTWNDARDAIEAGATAIAHLGEAPIPGDVLSLAASKGVFWIPTMSLYHGLTDLIADPSLLDDPLLAKVSTPRAIASYRPNALNVDADTMSWLGRHGGDAANVLALRRAGVKLLAGTDAVELGVFPGWSLHRELVLFVNAGLSPWDALAAATVDAGEFLGHDYGIQPGAEASILVLDASPIDDIRNTTKILTVYHRGR